MLKCTLLKINCYITDEYQDDEIFLKYKGEKIWPSEKYMKVSGGEARINVPINNLKQGTNLELELWDYDTWSLNDKLGVFNMLVDDRGGPFISDLIKTKGSGAKYSLEWEVS